MFSATRTLCHADRRIRIRTSARLESDENGRARKAAHSSPAFSRFQEPFAGGYGISLSE